MKTLVTSALPYANGSMHLGHVRSTYIPADIYVRFLRSKGDDVKYVCGTDEHGTPIVIKAESDFNPYAVSKKGAQGLMQLMPKTLKDLKVYDPFHPRENIDGGVRYLKRLLKQFNNDISLTLAAYHAGAKTVEKYEDIPPYQETQHYVKKVLNYFDRYRQEI